MKRGENILERIAKYLKSIRRHYPDVPLVNVKEIGSGQNNAVFQVGSDLIFRFPRYATGVEQLNREIRLLRIISNHVSLRVPHPIYHALDNDSETHAFMGYIMMNGEPLEAEKLSRIHDENALRRIAGQLSNFLIELHNVDLRHMAWMEKEHDPLYEWSDLYRRIQEKLYPYMKERACKRTERHFTHFLANEANAAIAPSVIHGDFGASNILYEPSNGQIAGVIDFGSAHIGDPAVDYAALLASYGEKFFGMVMEHNPNVKAMMERVLFYKGTFALQEALFGLENGDPVAFQSGITAVNSDIT